MGPKNEAELENKECPFSTPNFTSIQHAFHLLLGEDKSMKENLWQTSPQPKHRVMLQEFEVY